MDTGTTIGLGPQRASPRAAPLPPAIEAGLKILVLYLLLQRWPVYEVAWFGLPYLPFVSWLDAIPAAVFCGPLLLVLVVGPVAIFLNYRPQLAAFCLGWALILEVVASKPLYSTSQLFLGYLFVLIGLYRGSTFPFRLQLALLYLGAALNKALEPDWWNGHYMQGLATTFGGPLRPWLDWVAETHAAAVTLGVATVVMEVALGLLYLVPRYTRQATFLGLFFHGGMLVMTLGALSWVYFYLCAAAYLLLWDGETGAKGLGPGPLAIHRAQVVYVYAFFISIIVLRHLRGVAASLF